MRLSEALMVMQHQVGITDNELANALQKIQWGQFPISLQEVIHEGLRALQDPEATREYCTLWNRTPESLILGVIDPSSILRRGAQPADPTPVAPPVKKDNRTVPLTEDQQELVELINLSNKETATVTVGEPQSPKDAPKPATPKAPKAASPKGPKGPKGPKAKPKATSPKA